jgi:hypothetical protein
MRRRADLQGCGCCRARVAQVGRGRAGRAGVSIRLAVNGTPSRSKPMVCSTTFVVTLPGASGQISSVRKRLESNEVLPSPVSPTACAARMYVGWVEWQGYLRATRHARTSQGQLGVRHHDCDGLALALQLPQGLLLQAFSELRRQRYTTIKLRRNDTDDDIGEHRAGWSRLVPSGRCQCGSRATSAWHHNLLWWETRESCGVWRLPSPSDNRTTYSRTVYLT